MPGSVISMFKPVRRPHFGAPARRLPRLFNQQRSIEIDPSLRDDLLAELCPQFRRLNLFHRAIVEIAKVEWTKGDADEATYLQAEGLEDLANLAVLALADAEGEPDIGALFAVKRRLDRSVADTIDRDTAAQPVECFLSNAAECAHAI